MTWHYESFWVAPKGWEAWSKSYPNVELRWLLKVVRENRFSGRWKIVEGMYSGIHFTRLDQEHLDKRFDTWQDAVDEAHELVSTVAVGGFGSRARTWPQAKSMVESERDAVLF